MKVRIVIEEVVVDAEFGDTYSSGAVEALVQVCAAEAIKLHNTRKKEEKKP